MKKLITLLMLAASFSVFGQYSGGVSQIQLNTKADKDGTNLDTDFADNAGLVESAGDTMTGSLLTTVDQLTTAPAGDEFVTADFVRTRAMQGSEWYFTTTVTNYLNDKTVNTNFVALSTVQPVDVFTNSIANVTTNDPYKVGGVVTQRYSIVSGLVSIEAWVAIANGSVNSELGVAGNVYLYEAGTTNVIAEYYAPPQTLTSTIPMKYIWEMSVPTTESTAFIDVVAYLKVETATTGPAECDLNVYGGGIYASHIDLPGTVEGQSPSELIALIDGKVDLNGSNSVFNVANFVDNYNSTNWTAVLSWDASNKVFTVSETGVAE